MIELVKTLKFNDLIMVEPMMIKFIIFNINNVNKYKQLNYMFFKIKINNC